MANSEVEVIRIATCKPLVVLRFIDNIFFIMDRSRDELFEYINLLNCHDNKSIRIDYDINIYEVLRSLAT